MNFGSIQEIFRAVYCDTNTSTGEVREALEHRESLEHREHRPGGDNTEEENRYMTASEDEVEVFSPGASPELRRSSRTSARKRASTGSAPYSRPKSKKKMQTVRSPIMRGQSEADRQADPLPATAAPVAGDVGHNPFASLGQGGSHADGQPPQAAPVAVDLLAQMQNMMGGMLGGMETRLNKASSELRSSVDQAMVSISDLSARVSSNEKRMDGVLSEMEAMVERKVEEGLKNHGLPVGRSQDMEVASNSMEETITTGRSYAAAVVGGRQEGSREDRREVDYWRSRRSLRMRPVDCGDEVEMVTKYMREMLRLEDSFLDMIRGRFTAKRVPFGPKAKYKNEILVSYESVEARDVVRSAATNLAGKGPDYGIRLEVPNHLRTAMRSLQTLSYELRQKNPEARRNILYDDETQNLVLDFQLRAAAPWRRVTSTQAMAKRAKIGGPSSGGLTVGDDELDSILNGNISGRITQDEP